MQARRCLGVAESDVHQRDDFVDGLQTIWYDWYYLCNEDGHLVTG